ncbi:MAG: glycosyltransferase [Candidatus Lernaella stagnicola]|nr:glycosyltransferase [Candidatus Lernaella stagnicola]
MLDLAGRRVLITTAHKNIRSGGSIQLFLLARSLVRAGARVDAVFNHRAGATQSESNLLLLNDLGINVHFLRFSRWYSPAQVLAFRKLLRAGRYDIVHSHKGSDLSLALLASWGMAIPCLVNTRGVNFRLGLNRFKYRSLRLDRIIVVSKNSKAVMVDCGVPAEKIRVIYGGVDTDRFRPQPDLREVVRNELGLPADAQVSVVAANLVRQKGHGDYLKAAALLKQDHPALYHVFAGGGDQSDLQAKAAALGVADRVVFAGFRTDMERVYAACDFSVMPSFAGEGVSGVLREAMACGLPVITTDVGGNAELVVHEKYGLVTPVRDPEALAGAMAGLVKNPAYSQALAAAGRRFVLDRFSAESRARQIFALYEHVLQSKKRG